MRNYISCILFMAISFCANAQNGKLLVKVKELPVRDGVIYKFETGYHIYSRDGIEVFSATDSVFSVVEGEVSFTYDFGNDDWAVCIKSKTSTFYVLSNLKSTSLNKGGRVSKGDFIGLIKPDEENKLHLLFMMVNKSGQFHGEEQTIAFLKAINPPNCHPNEQPIVAR